MSDTPEYQRFFAELKRRHVFKVAAVYGATAFVVLQVAELLSQGLQLPPAFLTVVTVFTLLGFPIAVVMAWAYDRTAAGLERTRAATPGELSEILGQPAARRWPVGLAAAGGTALLIVGGWLALGRPGAVGTDPGEVSSGPGGAGAALAAAAAADGRASIAVLPFHNISGDAENQPFTDGIHGDVILQLSKIGSLKVISRTSVMEYRETTKNVREIAAELGAGHLLEGEVQRSGEAFRINAQLIDASTDEHVWSEQYDGELTMASIFTVQSEIAGSITDALRATLTDEEREMIASPPTDDLIAYEAYLEGREYFDEGYTEGNFRTADIKAQQAIDRDPEFAEAYALRAVNATMLYHFFYDRSDSIRQAALDHIARAREIDPDVAEVHWAMGHYYYRMDLDYERALEEVELAIEKGYRDSEIHELAASILRRKGDMEGAVREFVRAAELDPRAVLPMFSVGETLTLLRRYEEAEDWLQRTYELRPDFGLTYFYLANARLLADGDTTGAREWLERRRDLRLPEETNDFSVVNLYLNSGQARPARAALEADLTLLDTQFLYRPVALYSGLIWSLDGDSVRAVQAFDSARVELESRVKEDPMEARYRTSLGLALAGLGLAEEAIREGEEGVRLMSPEIEAWRGTYRVRDLAQIYAMIGRTDEAIDQLDYLLSIPAEISPATLRLNPAWDPLREDPRFQALVE